MYKIGIIGSDNSHAEAFSKLVNIPDIKTGKFLFPDFKVTSIFGLDKERTHQVAEDGEIPAIVEDPNELIGNVDAVMVVFRHGDLHAKYAVPFIEAGIPTWVDKPFAIKDSDADILIKAAQKSGTLLMGGSTVKHTYDILMLKNAVENENRIGQIKSAVLNFPATLENEYGGIYFYGAHLVEMTLNAFGYNPMSVTAIENNGSAMAVLKYDDYHIAMNFVEDSKEFYAIVYGDKGTIIREIDISGCYKRGFENFAETLRGNILPMPLINFKTAVKVLNAVKESYQTKKEVELSN